MDDRVKKMDYRVNETKTSCDKENPELAQTAAGKG